VTPSSTRTGDPLGAERLFRVTHPFHPWYGRTFELLERRTTWGEDRVYFHDDAGQLPRLPAAWTSAAVRSPYEILAGGRSPFRVADLLQLVALIARQRAVQTAPASTGKSAKGSRK
jgi:hypothetical protein